MNAVISAPDQPAQTTVSPPLRWTQRFHQLGGRFFTELDAQPVPSPYWVAHNESLARDLGLPPDWLTRPEFRSIDVLSGNALWPGTQPLASVYSGHQFGVWAGQLGDGRALWLGEIETPLGPQEIQLKGAGLTPYSRMGDGRAVLRSSIREFLCSEAMHGLGIPTTRALAVTGSPLTVRREEIETAAIVTRVAPSFIRFGHFEHFAHTAGDDGHEALRTLADFVIDHYYPECRDSSSPYATLLQAIAERTGRLIAQWQCVGFCHGVMNTDNMSILGLTIDYGPFGFLDGFDPGHICNHSDNRGRYAYARQPNAGFWNVHALAQALMPLIGDSDAALEAIEPYKAALGHALQAGMRGKLGLAQVRDDDAALIDALFALMSRDKTDMTILFRRLSTFSTADGANHDALRDLFIDREAFDAWASRYADRLNSEQSDDTARRLAMNRVNPKYVLRNHLADVAIRQAREGDFNETRRLLALLERPFDDQPDNERYADFPPAWAQHIEVSCSS